MLHYLFEERKPFTKRLYHGTQSRPDYTSAQHTGYNSTAFGPYNSERHAIFLTDDPNFASLYGNVYTFEVRFKNMFDGDLKEMAFRAARTIDAHGPNRDIWIDLMNVRDEMIWALFEDELGEYFVSYMKDQGYDSVFFEEEHSEAGKSTMVNTYAAFDPTSIKMVD